MQLHACNQRDVRAEISKPPWKKLLRPFSSSHHLFVCGYVGFWSICKSRSRLLRENKKPSVLFAFQNKLVVRATICSSLWYFTVYCCRGELLAFDEAPPCAFHSTHIFPSLYFLLFLICWSPTQHGVAMRRLQSIKTDANNILFQSAIAETVVCLSFIISRQIPDEK